MSQLQTQLKRYIITFDPRDLTIAMTTAAKPNHRSQHPSGHNHKEFVNQALGIAERLCIQRGVQLTAIRHKVLELIWESHKAVKAYELLDRHKPLQQAAKPVTIYRALDFLIEQGLIHRVESLNAFVGCRCSGHQHEQLLLICKYCHEVEERSATDVMSALTQEVKQADFIVHSKAAGSRYFCERFFRASC